MSRLLLLLLFKIHISTFSHISYHYINYVTWKLSVWRFSMVQTSGFQVFKPSGFQTLRSQCRSFADMQWKHVHMEKHSSAEEKYLHHNSSVYCFTDMKYLLIEILWLVSIDIVSCTSYGLKPNHKKINIR